MGRWGVGNFESDSAAEWMHEELEHDLVTELRETVADPALCEAGEPSAEALLCALDVLTLVTKRLHHVLPSRDEIRHWKGVYLERWDATADDCWPSPENLKKRRKVIVRTFDQAIRASSPDPDWTPAQTRQKLAKKKPVKKKPVKKKRAKKKRAKKKRVKKKR